jgi:hypothetical protein
MAVGTMVIYCVSASDAAAIQARSRLHAPARVGFQAALGHYPVAGENLPAVTVKDVDATHKDLQILLPGDGSWWKANAVQGAVNTQGTWS